MKKYYHIIFKYGKDMELGSRSCSSGFWANSREEAIAQFKQDWAWMIRDADPDKYITINAEDNVFMYVVNTIKANYKEIKKNGWGWGDVAARLVFMFLSRKG